MLLSISYASICIFLHDAKIIYANTFYTIFIPMFPPAFPTHIFYLFIKIIVRLQRKYFIIYSLYYYGIF